MEKHEGMKLRNIDEIKAKFSSVKELKGREKLSDENLEKISGGYIEESAPNYGDNVVCPNCGEDRESQITYAYDPTDPSTVEYHCYTCGRDFYYNGAYVYF